MRMLRMNNFFSSRGGESMMQKVAQEVTLEREKIVQLRCLFHILSQGRSMAHLAVVKSCFRSSMF